MSVDISTRLRLAVAAGATAFTLWRRGGSDFQVNMLMGSGWTCETRGDIIEALDACLARREDQGKRVAWVALHDAHQVLQAMLQSDEDREAILMWRAWKTAQKRLRDVLNPMDNGDDV